MAEMDWPGAFISLFRGTSSQRDCNWSAGQLRGIWCKKRLVLVCSWSARYVFRRFELLRGV